MIKVRISGKVDATLRNGEWRCDQPAVLKLLQTLTSGVSIGGYVPNADRHICQEVGKLLKVEILDAPPPPDPPAREVVF